MNGFWYVLVAASGGAVGWGLHGFRDLYRSIADYQRRRKTT